MPRVIHIDGMPVYTWQGWGAKANPNDLDRHTITPDGIVFIHHSAFFAKSIDTFEEQCEAMRSMEAYHLGKGWSAIGYSYVVFQPRGKVKSARVFLGRGFEHIPAAQQGRNTGHGAICVAGDFEREGVKRETANTLVRLAQEFPGGYIAGHRDNRHDTQCPGDHLYAAINRLAQRSGKRRFR
jgi:hypothetical protein